MFKKNSFEKILKKAEKELQNERYDESKNTYLECLALEPDNVCVLNNLAQIYSILGDNEKSKSYNEILLEECNKQLKYAQDETILMLKTNALISLKRNLELNESVDALLKINPTNIVGLFQKAHCLEKTNQNQKAIICIDKIIKQQPHNISALLFKGRNLVELEEFKLAENVYNIVFKIDPKNENAANLKSQLLKKKNNVNITPHDFMYKALKHWQMDDFEISASYFKKAIDLNQNYDEIWFAQGELFIRIGRIGDAIQSFKKAFEINPDSGGIEKHDAFFKLLERMKKINILFGFEK